jgi:capsular polysaccharide biosynthesis protein
VVILPSRTDVTLDPRLQTEQGSIGLTTRQEGLTAMVQSNAVLQQVLAEAGQALPPEQRSRERLRGMMETEISGDLIRVNVRHSDPQVATEIANSLVQHYERHVNDVYRRNYLAEGNTAAQVAQAREAYEAEQQALEAFVAEDRAPVLQREIETRQALLESYQETLVNVQTNPLSSRQALLQSYYTELREIERALADAAALRAQVAADTGSPVGNVGNTLALILLRSRVLGGESDSVDGQDSSTSAGNSMILQLDLSGVSAETIRPADVDSLISVLEERRRAAEGRIEALVNAVNAGEGAAEATVPAESQLLRRISELEAEIATLQGEVEALTAERRELEQARDQAWDTYQLLVGRQTEEEIASGAGDAQVHVADTAIVPTQPEPRGLLLNTVLAAVVAAMAAVGIVLLSEWWTAGDTALWPAEGPATAEPPSAAEEPAAEPGTPHAPGAPRRQPS